MTDQDKIRFFGAEVPVEELKRMPVEDAVALSGRLQWEAIQHDYQAVPPGDWWTIWLLLAGRGAGKTRTGVETLWQWAWQNPGTRWLAAAPTYSDFDKTLFNGESGLIATMPKSIIASYNKSDYVMTLKNGSIITGISAEKPDRFRGPQFHGGLLDELAAWQNPQESFDMIMFTMRLGRLPRIMITTTPKPIPLIRKLVARSTGRKADVVITRASTYDNAENLAPTLRAQLTQYEGTQLGRQEIHGEVLDPEEQGVIKRSWWRMWPKDRNEPVFEMIIVSFDTAFTEATRNKEGKPDPTGCSVWGLFREFGKTDEPGRDGLMLLRSWKDHLGFPDLLRAAPKEMERSYGNYNKPEIRTGWGRPLIETAGNKGGRKPDLLIIEDKGSGISLRQMLEREGIYAYAYNPGRASKLQRLHAVSHMFKNGYVWFKEGPIPGQPRKDDEELITEVCTFSGEGTTEHDDLVDSTTQALRYLIDAHQLSVAAPRHDEDVSIDYDDDIEDDPKERSGPYG